MDQQVIDGAVFHSGELAAQAQVGMADKMQRIGQQYIRPFFLNQHLEFFSQLPFIVVAACDEEGIPWVTILTGKTGFISSQDDRHLHIASHLAVGDALQHALIDGAYVGLIGIEFDTKRRNRANGQLSKVSANSLTFKVAHSYGNCPQYINSKQSPLISRAPFQAQRHSYLTEQMQGWIKNSDTLFIGSGTKAISQSEQTANTLLLSSQGMDASHRGGQVGFVKVVSDNQLVLPDYSGNNFFNTIGNILLNPKIGLLFIDFAKGLLLQISGRAKVDWQLPNQHNFAGAQRLILIEVDKAVICQYR